MIYSSNHIKSDFAPYGNALCQLLQAASATRGIKAQERLDWIDQLPTILPSRVDLNLDRVVIGRPADLSDPQRKRLNEVLHSLKPWRKGPFDVFGTHIDSEWNSAMKWNRVTPHLAPLRNHRVLDVGSSNGYYLFRMAAAKPRIILGIEPYFAYYAQFMALSKYLQLPSVYCLPLKLEDLPVMTDWFDSIFCMGILYHRRSPLDTLSLLKTMLAPGGQLILETLIIESSEEKALCPQDRYARMRNVYFIPSVPCLHNWLARCGFSDIRCVDVTPTSVVEQRKTNWIDSDSLASFLDPDDDRKTLEGYPAPLRAVILATRE